MSHVSQRQPFSPPNRVRPYTLLGVVAALVVGIGLVAVCGSAESAGRGEYDIKAACLYNFAQFVTWPKTKVADGNDTLVIGVIGEDSFRNAFDPIMGKRIHGLTLVVTKFKGPSQMRTQNGIDQAQLDRDVTRWRKCHVAFISASEAKEIEAILRSVRGHNVLTVGETENFVDSGGMIGFVPAEGKTHFEVNLVAAKKENLSISASVLRLAKRVLQNAS
jgi:hypothetical protein